MKAADFNEAPTAPCTVYVKGNLTIVPSYHNQDEFVLPGHTKKTPRPTVTAAQLKNAGFIAARRELWVRG
jgi:hypothetical protein